MSESISRILKQFDVNLSTIEFGNLRIYNISVSNKRDENNPFHVVFTLSNLNESELIRQADEIVDEILTRNLFPYS